MFEFTGVTCVSFILLINLNFPLLYHCRQYQQMYSGWTFLQPQPEVRQGSDHRFQQQYFMSPKPTQNHFDYPYSSNTEMEQVEKEVLEIMDRIKEVAMSAVFPLKFFLLTLPFAIPIIPLTFAKNLLESSKSHEENPPMKPTTTTPRPVSTMKTTKGTTTPSSTTMSTTPVSKMTSTTPTSTTASTTTPTTTTTTTTPTTTTTSTTTPTTTMETTTTPTTTTTSTTTPTSTMETTTTPASTSTTSPPTSTTTTEAAATTPPATTSDAPITPPANNETKSAISQFFENYSINNRLVPLDQILKKHSDFRSPPDNPSPRPLFKYPLFLNSSSLGNDYYEYADLS